MRAVLAEHDSNFNAVCGKMPGRREREQQAKNIINKALEGPFHPLGEPLHLCREPCLLLQRLGVAMRRG